VEHERVLLHTVSIALPVVAVLLGVTTPATAFSGFSSTTWFLVLGVFGISASVAKTVFFTG